MFFALAEVLKNSVVSMVAKHGTMDVEDAPPLTVRVEGRHANAADRQVPLACDAREALWSPSNKAAFSFLAYRQLASWCVIAALASQRRTVGASGTGTSPRHAPEPTLISSTRVEWFRAKRRSHTASGVRARRGARGVGDARRSLCSTSHTCSGLH